MEMTREILEQLRPLKAEIKALQNEIHDLPTVTDCVTGSQTEFPYVKHRIKISGVDEISKSRLETKLAHKMERLQSDVSQMEQWLDSVNDSEMRMILRLRYRNGMSWQKIAFEIGHYDEQYPRRKCNKFLKKVQR